jgi:hypothetical protein
MAVPGVVTDEFALAVKHVVLGPFPEAIKLGLLIHLHGEHHAIGLTLRSHVRVFDVGDVRCLVGRGVKQTLRGWIAKGELLPYSREFGIEFGLGLAQMLSKEILIMAGLEGRFVFGHSGKGDTHEKKTPGQAGLENFHQKERECLWVYRSKEDWRKGTSGAKNRLFAANMTGISGFSYPLI